MLSLIQHRDNPTQEGNHCILPIMLESMSKIRLNLFDFRDNHPINQSDNRFIISNILPFHPCCGSRDNGIAGSRAADRRYLNRSGLRKFIRPSSGSPSYRGRLDVLVSHRSRSSLSRYILPNGTRRHRGGHCRVRIGGKDQFLFIRMLTEPATKGLLGNLEELNEAVGLLFKGCIDRKALE